MGVAIQLGRPDDVEDALAVYERSNLARRHGIWPSRESRLDRVANNLRDPGSWFLIGRDDGQPVAMASVLPFRLGRGAGPRVPRTSWLDLIYVVPERWAEGIGGLVLDAVIAEAARRDAPRIYLSTHERDNERAQRLYRSRAFGRTGVTATDESGAPVAEWMRDGSQ